MVSLGPINYKLKNYSVNFNDSLRGQVDKEEEKVVGIDTDRLNPVHMQ